MGVTLPVLRSPQGVVGSTGSVQSNEAEGRISACELRRRRWIWGTVRVWFFDENKAILVHLKALACEDDKTKKIECWIHT